MLRAPRPSTAARLTTGPLSRSRNIPLRYNRQKAATQTLLDQGARIDQSISQLSGAFQVTKQLGEQNLRLRQELTTTQKRLDALEQELRKKQAEIVFGANDRNKTNEW